MNACFDATAPAQPPSGPAALWAQLLVDEIDCGLVVCTGNGRIVFANQAAQRELASARVLHQDSGQLKRSATTTGALEHALTRATLCGRRQLVALAAGADRLLVSVSPLPSAGEPHALVMLGRRQSCSDLGLEMVASAHGLTLAERRVLGALMRGRAPRQIAEQHDVKLSTVRAQIGAIRRKFDARNIDAVLLRLAETPPVAGALRLSYAAAVAAPPYPRAA